MLTNSKSFYDYSNPVYKRRENAIAVLFFKNSEVQEKSEYKIQTLLDLVAKLSGIPSLSQLVLGFLIGKYMKFLSLLTIVESFEASGD